jgi:hypothetical protein
MGLLLARRLWRPRVERAHGTFALLVDQGQGGPEAAEQAAVSAPVPRIRFSTAVAYQAERVATVGNLTLLCSATSLAGFVAGMVHRVMPLFGT